LIFPPNKREIGKANFHRSVGQLAEQSESGVTRRDFMKGLLAAGAAVPITAAPISATRTTRLPAGRSRRPHRRRRRRRRPRGFHNPQYLEFVAVCDIRPYNQKRIFTGDSTYPISPRKGFNRIYGKDAAKKIKVLTDYSGNPAKQGHRGGRDRPAFEPPRAGCHRLHEGQEARPLRKAHGLEHHRVQADDQGRRGE